MSGNRFMGMSDADYAELMARLLKWGKRFYWIFGILALLYLCYVLFTRNQQIASILVFLSGFIALYFYYVKWFVIPDRIPNWPPYSTPCPDFLTLVEPGDGNTVPAKCMDFVGVSANGVLSATTPSSVNTAKNDANYYFSVARKYRDSATGKIMDTSLGDICSEVRAKGLTWLSLCPDE